MNADVLTGGFNDAARESANAFRMMLDALSRPGTIQKMPDYIKPPAPLAPNTAAVLLTLVDHDTSLWLAPEMENEAVKRFLQFQTGVQLVSEPSAADFALVSSTDIPSFDDFSVGTAEYPDRSVTLIIQIENSDSGMPVHFSGPGVKSTQEFNASGLDEAFWKQVQQNNKQFPLGLDFMFCSSQGIAACPRSATVSINELVPCM